MENSFTNKPIFSSSTNNPISLSSASCYLEKNGFNVNKRSNFDAGLQVNKNSSLKILHGNFKTDVEKDFFIFDGYFPVFIEPANQKVNYEKILDSDLYINGLENKGLFFVSGNTYRLRFPKIFGQIKFTENNSISKVFVEEKDSFYTCDIRFLTNNINFTIYFDNLNSVAIKCRCFSPKENSNKLGVKHFLNFYDFELHNNQWYLFSPKFINVTSSKKSLYSYFKSSGDLECFYLNGYDSPILIFNYDTVYAIKNIDKKQKPFYFDYYAEGMLKFPYQDFDNDINTERNNLIVVFRGSNVSNNFVYNELDQDPYFNIEANTRAAYNPESIYYACSNRKYFGNKILIGRRRISEILGFFGKSSPEVTTFEFKQTGEYNIYDLFNHVSGRFIPISVAELQNKIISNENDAKLLKINSNEEKYINKNYDNIEYNIIGNIFDSLEEMVVYIYSKKEFDKKVYGSGIVINIEKEILEVKNGKNKLQIEYEKFSNNIGNFEENFSVFLQNMISKIKKDGAFEVMIKIL